MIEHGKERECNALDYATRMTIDFEKSVAISIHRSVELCCDIGGLCASYEPENKRLLPILVATTVGMFQLLIFGLLSVTVASASQPWMGYYAAVNLNASGTQVRLRCSRKAF